MSKQKHIWLSKEELELSVEHVPAPKIRNRLLVLLQYFTGLRRQEIVDIRLSDLDREDRKVRVRGKGNKINTAYYQSKLDGLLTTWIDGGYRDASPYARDSPYLFVTQSTPQLSPGRVSYIVRVAAKEADIQEVLYVNAADKDQNKVTSYTLRHSFAMHYLKNGGSIEGLSKLMAHSSVTTTEIYGEILDDRAEEEYRKFAPTVDF